MTTLTRTASWVICNKLTGKAVFETFNKNTADAFRDPRSSFEAVPILQYLQSLNGQWRVA